MAFWKVQRAPRSFATSKAFFPLPAPESAITLACRNNRVSSRSISNPFRSYVLVNNRSEGNATLTIQALTDHIIETPHD